MSVADMYITNTFVANTFVSNMFIADMFVADTFVAQNRGVERWLTFVAWLTVVISDGLFYRYIVI